MIGGLGAPELIIIAVVVVLLFGTRRLPELGSGIGKAISNFRKSYKEGSAIDVTPSEEDAAATDNSQSGPEKSGGPE